MELCWRTSRNRFRRNPKSSTNPSPERLSRLVPIPLKLLRKRSKISKRNRLNRSRRERKLRLLLRLSLAGVRRACGLISKPKENIIDIDAADVNNDLAVVEYLEDICIYYKSAEAESATAALNWSGSVLGSLPITFNFDYYPFH